MEKGTDWGLPLDGKRDRRGWSCRWVFIGFLEHAQCANGAFGKYHVDRSIGQLETLSIPTESQGCRFQVLEKSMSPDWEQARGGVMVH